MNAVKSYLASKAVCRGQVRTLHVWSVDAKGSIEGKPLAEETASTIYLDGNIVIGNKKIIEEKHLRAISEILDADERDFVAVVSYMQENALDYHELESDGAIVEILPPKYRQRLRVVFRVQEFHKTSV